MTAADSTALIELMEGPAQRCQAYAALLGFLVPEVEPRALGQLSEKWATFISAAGVPKSESLFVLRLYSDFIPTVSLARVCKTLDIEPREVFEA